MKVQSISKEVRVSVANIVEQMHEWKALKALAEMRQEELMRIAASNTTCTLEELRITQGRLLEVKSFIDLILDIHKHENKL